MELRIDRVRINRSRPVYMYISRDSSQQHNKMAFARCEWALKLVKRPDLTKSSIKTFFSTCPILYHRRYNKQMRQLLYEPMCQWFGAPLVAVRLNYKFVTKSYVFTDHFNQSNFHFVTIQMFLFISDILFLCLIFPKYNLSICIVHF